MTVPGLTSRAGSVVPFASVIFTFPYTEPPSPPDDTVVVDVVCVVVDVEVVDDVVVDVDEVVEDVVVDVVVDVVEDVVVTVGAALEPDAVRPPMLITCVPGPHWFTHITRKL